MKLYPEFLGQNAILDKSFCFIFYALWNPFADVKLLKIIVAFRTRVHALDRTNMFENTKV